MNPRAGGRALRVLGCAAAALAALGCNQDPGADNGKGLYAPAPLPSATATTGGPAYPAPPYGVTQGSTIDDFTFQGYRDPQTQSSSLEAISLSDFYNPDGKPGRPTALLIDIASVWCGPCNEEAKTVLNGLYARYEPCGGEFLFQLAEGTAPGEPATEHLLQLWTSQYKVAYPATIDPSRQLYPLYASDSFPDSAIVDTRTMRIVDVISGVPDAAFWSTYESLLDPTCLSSH